ncbi:hypothetical protein [Roseisalinus antarcticus]|uniref:Lipoprotein n=1 Tax=Roseisalinus antarcticus TaxID=254357 RepID=A0A1Y5RR01_9RHOB|nr:hypothetical protein [Roseisalinus antarcticus]SLN23232.1 hypothetical protein ROA7023_00692 [Roseisalinus antarcticus]
MIRFALIPALAVLVGCGPVSPDRAADLCEQRARDAQGPSGALRVGTNSRNGPYVNGEISVTSDYLQGRDPMELYRSCVFNYTGGSPIRPPRLRGPR